MIPITETADEALRSALRAARQNAERWMEMYPESSTDIEGLEQWRSIARLRRLEVERLERLLAQMAEHRGSPGGAGYENAHGGDLQGATP